MSCTYKFSNEEFKALIALNSRTASRYVDCTRHEMAPGSSIYVHDRDGFTFYTATGDEAALFCKQLLGLSTKRDSKGYPAWYLYDIARDVA